MASKEWKSSERKIAELLGGKRIPINGRKGPDIEHKIFAIEHKYGQRIISSRIKQALEQAYDAGIKTGKIPIVTYEESGSKGKENLKGVIIDMKAFLYLVNYFTDPQTYESE